MNKRIGRKSYSSFNFKTLKTKYYLPNNGVVKYICLGK